jgi:hypothetical protein
LHFTTPLLLKALRYFRETDPFGFSVVPRPVYADGLLLSCGGSDKLFMYCIRPEGASGDITDATNLVRESARNIPSMPSPLMAGNRLYILNAATMSGLEPATGNKIGAPNLPGLHLASVPPRGASLTLQKKGPASRPAPLRARKEPLSRSPSARPRAG